MTASARAAIRRLRTGVVPIWEFDLLSVGYDRVKQNVGNSLSELKRTGRAEPLFVRGEWGTGKTHFLSYVQATAAGRDFATAIVGLNARSAALSHPQRFFPVLAESIRARASTGLRGLILDSLYDDGMRESLKRLAASSVCGDLQWAVASLCLNFESGERLQLGNHPAWRSVYGADLCWSDHASKREKAVSRIAAVAGLCRAVGLGGLVLVLDETETIDQLWNIRSRMSAYGVLGRLCRMPATWCVLATTMRFDRMLERDLVSDFLKSQLVNADAVAFLARWGQGGRNTIQPPAVDERNAYDLATAVCSLYEAAYQEVRGSASIIERCLDEWTGNPGRNPRRLIRLLIDAFDASRVLSPVPSRRPN